MSDRFGFLEFDKPRTESPPSETPQEVDATSPPESPTWRQRRLRAVEVIGEAGTEVGQFSGPTGLTVDPWGALYVVDSNNHRVQRITPGGDVTVFGRAGHAAGEFWGPQSVAVDPSGQFVFVAEQGNHRVQCLHFLGQPRGVMGGCRNPSGLAFDAQGMLWIADTGNQRVLRLKVQIGSNSISADMVGGFDRTAGFQRPASIASDAAYNVYITDSVHQNVIRYSYAGIRGLGLADHRRLREPGQVAIDVEGRIYLTEMEANRLHVFSLQGESLAVFDNPGPKLGPLNRPSGVALGPNGEIYLADTLQNRVLRLAWE